MEITNQDRDDFVKSIKATLDTHAFFQNCTQEIFDHNFLGFGTHPSICRVNIFFYDPYYIVVFQDLGLDTGTSITNASGQLATEIARLKNLPNDKTVWMECYTDQNRFDVDAIFYNYDPKLNKYSVPKWQRSQNEILIKYLRDYLKIG